MALKIPFRPKLFNRPKKPYRYIIIHDINCQFGTDEEQFYNDSKKFQTSDLRSRHYIMSGDTELPYHYMIERVGKDYETINCRPLSLMCDYDDIQSPYELSVHIGMMGSFSINFPNNRYYKQMAFRAISSIMKIYRINHNRIFLHHEISSNDDCNCPGTLFGKTELLSQVKPMLATQR